MVLSYLLPIGCVGYHYQSEKNNSVSSVLNMPECQMPILLGMISMGTFTLWYEWERGSLLSFLTILSVLIGIYGVILIEENTVVHYVFGGLIFFGMILFMVIHCSKSPTIFGSIFVIHIILSIILIIQCFCNTDIFVSEVALVMSFAIYYLYLHYVEMTESKPSVKEEKTEGEKTEGEKTDGEKTD
jgi:membrane-bound ClpP family serine protease